MERPSCSSGRAGAPRARRSPILAVALAAIGLMTVVYTPDVKATNFTGANGQTGCNVNVADNRTHGFFNNALTTATANAVAWTRTNNYDPTDINTTTASSQTALTDVVSFDADYEGVTCGQTWCCNAGSGLIGYSMCQALNSANECEQDFIYYDTDFMGPQSDANERSLACHETAHSVGLTHRNGSCVETPVPNNPALSTHDISHINNWAGYNS